MKIICITWGVLSGIGKWITAASIWTLLKSAGYKVFMQKLDGYLNVDPWTMSPFQHGEVFVTEDGAETDLDLGHYERFIDTNLNNYSSFSSGKLYQEILEKERRGDFLGKTVQIMPHLTDLVKEKIKKGYEKAQADISLIEIGGTVWDIENEYFLEAIRQLQAEYGRENVVFVHVTLLPYIAASKELKTKPTQHSVRTLMHYGITPDFLVLRGDTNIPQDIINKVAHTCYLKPEEVIPAETVSSIYQIPLAFQEKNFWTLIINKLFWKTPDTTNRKTIDMTEREHLYANIKNSEKTVTIGMIGKYNELEDAYISLNEGLKAAGFTHHHKVKLQFIDSTEIEQKGTEILKSVDGICMPWGFGDRGIEGMISATQYARENNIPFLGICLGSQIMAIEFARNVLNYTDANSEEFAPESKNQVVHIMEEQKNINKKWGTMRLGAYDCVIKKDSLAHECYQSEHISERHRHRFEFNNQYRNEMQNNGFIISGTSPDWNLVEIVEIQNHPFMIGTQAHPEFKSRPTNPHPLFMKFIEKSIENR